MAKKLVRRTITLADGTRVYFSGHTKKEAEAKRDEAKRLYNLGVCINDNTTVEELAKTWFECYKRKDLHLKSVETTEGILNRYIIPKLGHYRVREVRPLHIDKLLAEMSDYSYSTQKKILNYLGQIFDTAVENDLIMKSPMVGKKPIAKEAERVEPLTREQCSRLLEATYGTRVYPFIVVLMFCGLRKGEAIGLMWQDVDFNKGLISVERSVVYSVKDRRGIINQELKTSSARRKIPMSEEVVNVLSELKRNSTSLYVFPEKDGSYMSESSFRGMWNIISYRTLKEFGGKGGDSYEKLERTLNFSVHPHQLRHTCCTEWISSGMSPKEAQYLMGHADSGVTMDIYTHYVESQQLDKTAEKIRGLDRGIKMA